MKHSLLITLIVAVTACGAGAGAGVYLASELKPPITINEGLNGEDYEADIDAAWKKYNAAKSSGNFLNTMTPDELLNCSYKVYDDKEKHHAITVGYSAATVMGAAVKQNVLGTFIKDGDKFFEEQASTTGMIHIHNRMWQADGQTTCYWTQEGDWKNFKPVVMSNPEYREAMGSNLSRSCRYIVSEKTVIYGKLNKADLKVPTTQAVKNGDDIIVDVELDPVKTPCFYGKQMQTMSKLLCPPSFNYIHISLTMSAVDLFPKRMVVNEGYLATLSSGISSTCDSECHTVYYSDGNETMPELEAKFTYPDEL